jgi:hypothetical protein
LCIDNNEFPFNSGLLSDWFETLTIGVLVMRLKQKTLSSRPFILTAAAAALAIFWLGANDAVRADDFGPLLGRWQRVDGGYVIEVSRVQADGQMEAGYFNPRPINVAHARASSFNDKIKIELELRDKGYPGSAYTLVYVADKDVLIGYYYHAPSKQNIDVIFFRMN